MKKILSFLSSVFLVFTFSAATPAHATYLGDFCWNVTETGGFSIFKLGVTHVNSTRRRVNNQFAFTDLQTGDHLALNGIEVEEDGAPNPDGEVVYGSADVVGDELIMTLSSTYSDVDEMGAGAFYVRLSLATLSGDYVATGTVLDKALEVLTSGHEINVITSVPCP